MEKVDGFTLAVSLIPLFVAFILFPFLPETIPIHFSVGAPDSWSSKSGAAGIIALFLLPLISPVLCGVLITTQNTLDKKRTPKPIFAAIKAAALLSSVVFLIVFSLIICLVLENIMLNMEPLDNLNKISLVGAILIILGPLMVFVGRNEYFGVRTPGSMKDDSSWKMSQRFGAVASVASGSAMIIGNLYIDNFFFSVIFVISVSLILGISCYVQSHLVSKKQPD
ncbi:MAG: SdpI family protein [Candidatus Methanoplasma sp.]|nr:SdpI family protein [Candidatus Methanoplasma sp.]